MIDSNIALNIVSVKRVMLMSNSQLSWYMTDDKGIQRAASEREFLEAAKLNNLTKHEYVKQNRTMLVETWSK